MKKNLIFSILFIGLIGVLSSCEKDETKTIMLTDPIAPSIVTVPSLTLARTSGNDTLEFIGKPVDPGFSASATYILEACATGNNFANAVTVKSDVQANSIKISVSDLNGILLKLFPADQVSSIDFRIRAILVVDAGTGALGTGSNPLVYASAPQTANVTLYGLPRLDLISGGNAIGKVESALGNGIYAGFVKLDPAKPYTLKDPDANKTYGAGGTGIILDGAAITPGTAGWFKMNVDVNALTYSVNPYMIGLVGSATANGWDSPDQKMDYDSQSGTWNITTNLKDGEIKFRLNDGWAWNLGGTPDKLVHNGDNIAVTAGNYSITLTITNATAGSEAGTFTIVKNN
ncbi:MAG TPA: SusE domain-containing protein [Bacteroidales bacterium]|nr:SusE domain-containing protein [Bacteroidales bacterium]